MTNREKGAGGKGERSSAPSRLSGELAPLPRRRSGVSTHSLYKDCGVLSNPVVVIHQAAPTAATQVLRTIESESRPAWVAADR